MHRWTRPAHSPEAADHGATYRSAKGPQAPPLPAAPDLYLRWAQATGWRGYRRGSGGEAGQPPGGELRILARAADRAGLAAALGCAWLQVPDFYRSPIPGGRRQALHFTARLQASDLPRLASELPGLRWELAVPSRAADGAAQANPLGEFGSFRDEASLRAKPVPRPRAQPGPPSAPAKLGDTIAVIDFGCPFLNEHFASDSGGTRVAALWDQDQRPPDPAHARWWQNPAGAGYGRELDADALDALVRGQRTAGGAAALDEASTYRGIDYLIAYDDPRRRIWYASHGGHLLDVAGGRTDPLTGAEDAASAAQLLFVQLPALTASDCSGGSLSAHLLDGVRYALKRCESTARLVVNISYGSFAGPHDGSALIETALAELLDARRRNFAIVLAAGNARQAGCHVRRTVRKNRSALLQLVLQAGDTTDTFVELWYAHPPGQPRLQVRTRTAQGDWSPWVQPQAQCALADPATGETVALLQHSHRVATGQRALVLLALCPTAAAVDDEGPLAEAGVWELEVAFVDADRPADTAQVSFDAWVERDDPGDHGAGGQPHFVGRQRGDENNTLSSLATGLHTVVVGGHCRSSGEAAPYSSLPATDSGARQPPLVYAACEEDALRPHIAAGAVRSGDLHRMNGTSVAAAVVARRLFNAMQGRDIGRAGWTRVIQALARNSEGVLRLPQP